MKSTNTLDLEIILIQSTLFYFYEASLNCNLNLEHFISEYKKLCAMPIEYKETKISNYVLFLIKT